MGLKKEETTTQSGNMEQAKQDLLNLVKLSSLDLLKRHCQIDVVNISDVAKDALVVKAYWMGIILIANSEFRILLRCHFASNTIVRLAEKVFKSKTVNEIEIYKLHDFMREYCNLTAGSIKGVLEKVEISVGISLPLITRGYDEIYFSNAKGNDMFSDQWIIGTEQDPVYISVTFEVLNPKILEKCTNIKYPDSSNDEELEFL